MPDIDRKTISATEIPGLFGKSPYITRFMLHHHFTGDVPIPQMEEQERMTWGKRLQQPVVDHLKEALYLDILNNGDDLYFRHPKHKIGCTHDSYVWSPDRGLGVIEIKCVDFLVFRDTWTENRAPDHIELQLQTQLLVPIPTDLKDIPNINMAGKDTTAFLQQHAGKVPQWGAIYCLVAGNQLKEYKRRPIKTVQKQIVEEVKGFFTGVEKREAPHVTGGEMEIDTLNKLYPHPDETVILDQDHFGDETEDVRTELSTYVYWRKQASAAKKEQDKAQVKIMGRFLGAGVIRLLGFRATLSRSHSDGEEKRLPVQADVAIRIACEKSWPDHIIEGLKMAREFFVTTKKPSTRSTLRVKRIEDEIENADNPIDGTETGYLGG